MHDIARKHEHCLVIKLHINCFCVFIVKLSHLVKVQMFHHVLFLSKLRAIWTMYIE